MKLIENWRDSWKFLSNITNIIGIMIITVLTDLPSHLVASWSIIPEEWKQSIPPEYIVYIAISFFILNIVARMIKQFKPEEDKDGKDRT